MNGVLASTGMNYNLLSHPIPRRQERHALSRKRSYDGYNESSTLELRSISTNSTKKQRSSRTLRMNMENNTGRTTQIPLQFSPYQATPPPCGGVDTPPNSMNSGSYFPLQSKSNSQTPTEEQSLYINYFSQDSVVAGRPPSPISDNGDLGSSLMGLEVCREQVTDMDIDMTMDFGQEIYKHSNPNLINEVLKPRLRMGYKSDCEKCRAKVPGHYSHFY